MSSRASQTEHEHRVPALFRDPPEWLREQVAACRHQGSPDRLLNPIAAAVASHLYGGPQRWQKLLPEVRSVLDVEGSQREEMR